MLMFAVVQNGHAHYFHYVPKSLSLTVSASSVDWPAAGFPCVCLSALRRRAARKRSARSNVAVIALFSLHWPYFNRHLFAGRVHLLHQGGIELVHRGIGVLALVVPDQKARGADPNRGCCWWRRHDLDTRFRFRNRFRQTTWQASNACQRERAGAGGRR